MMLKERLKMAERNFERLQLVVARFAHVVDAAKAFVEANPQFANADAAEKFQALVYAVYRLLPTGGA